MPEPLTIAYIADPNSIHTRRWLAFFASRGHRVHLLLEESARVEAEIDARVKVDRFAGYGARLRPLGALRARRSLRRVLREVRPDVVHAHYLTRFGWLARLAGRHPYVVSVWGSDILLAPRRSLLARALARWTLADADLVTGVFDHLIRAAEAHGAHADRIRLAQAGVDGERFRPGAAPAELRTRLGLEGARVLFAPRILAPLYRHEVEVEALAALPPDVRLVWTGMHARPDYLASLRSRAVELGVADRLVIVPAIEHDEMPDFYRLADVVVSIPESDGFPVTLMEAMASGTPLVASDLPGVRDGVGDAARPFLVPVGDVAATGASIRRALELPPAERAALGGALRDGVLSWGEMRVILGAIEREYYRLAGKPVGAAD